MVYLFLADGFEEIEALTPVDLLRRAGVEVVTVGVSGKTVTGSHGIAVSADVGAEEALAMLAAGTIPEMIVLPGGMPGAATLDASPLVDTFIDAAEKANAYIAAICAAPMILGKRGLLRGRHATCFPGFEEYLEGAAYMDVHTVTDGRYITGRAMGAATEFALALIKELKGEGAADALRAAVFA
jgi:4-methyl-5(b-hydroxyethyl)-thiazole monophosphate biosynthesis